TRQIGDQDGYFTLLIEYGGKAAELPALRDTGNLLSEVVSGLPVIVLNRRKFASAAAYCDRIIPIRTAGGETVLPALRPKKLLLNGVPVSAVVAFSAAETALVPPALLPAGTSPEETSQVSSY
ncbi:MAG: sigma-E processing peptidase SpoIIGA, partial [Clostridia bacterium]|nr:sigma-E processing peptidase SpoIIGA [Clostridia bacterium]